MLVARVVCLGLLALVALPSTAVAKDWWGWLEEFSGPGPFRVNKPWDTVHFTAFCGSEDEVDYHAPDLDPIRAATVTDYLSTFLAPLRTQFPDLKLEFKPDLVPLPPLTLPHGIELLMLPGATAAGGNLPPLSNATQAGRNQSQADNAGPTGPAGARELLIAETAIRRRLQPLGTPLPFRSVEARQIRTPLLAQGIRRAVATPRLNRQYCVYVDYAKFQAASDPMQGYPAIEATKVDVGLAYLMIGPMDLSATGGFLRFEPQVDLDPVFRWTFTPFRLQVRPLAWLARFAPNEGSQRGVARLAYAPKLYIKQTALLRSIRASEFGAATPPGETEFQTGPELVSSYGFAVDLTEIVWAFINRD